MSLKRGVYFKVFTSWQRGHVAANKIPLYFERGSMAATPNITTETKMIEAFNYLMESPWYNNWTLNDRSFQFFNEKPQIKVSPKIGGGGEGPWGGLGGPL